MHDKFFKDNEPEPIYTRARTLLAENNTPAWRPMRLRIVWDTVEQFVNYHKAKHPDLPAKLEYMKNIMQLVVDYHERLMVNSPELVTLNHSSCHGVRIPEKYRGEQKTDLIVAMRPFNERSGWFAAAGACASSHEQDYRPVVGGIYLNFYHIRVSKSNAFYIP